MAGRHLVLCEEPQLLRLCGEVHVETQHDIRFGRLAFEAQTTHEAARIIRADPGEFALADRLEPLLDGLAGPVFPDERPVAVDGEHGLRLRETRACNQPEHQCDRDAQEREWHPASLPLSDRPGRSGED
jgi:hypothetical protein